MRADAVVKEYVKRLSQDDLSFLGLRFKQNLTGDKAEIANKLAEDEEIDKWLATSTCADEWFDMVDSIGDCVKQEYGRRADEEDDRRPRKPRPYVKRDS